jgi:hypothetical protein
LVQFIPDSHRPPYSGPGFLPLPPTSILLPCRMF